MTMDRDFSLGEMFFVLFLFLGLIFIIAEIEDEKKPRRFTVKIDWSEYQADDYSLNIMKKGSHIQMNGDEYVAISDIKSVEILRNPGHPDKKGRTIDISEILKHAENFAQECHECHNEAKPFGDSIADMVAKKAKRTAPNAGKKMSEEQKAKISASLKKMNAQKRATAKKAVNLKK